MAPRGLSAAAGHIHSPEQALLRRSPIALYNLLSNFAFIRREERSISSYDESHAGAS